MLIRRSAMRIDFVMAAISRATAGRRGRVYQLIILRYRTKNSKIRSHFVLASVTLVCILSSSPELHPKRRQHATRAPSRCFCVCFRRRNRASLNRRPGISHSSKRKSRHVRTYPGRALSPPYVSARHVACFRRRQSRIRSPRSASAKSLCLGSLANVRFPSGRGTVKRDEN